MKPTFFLTPAAFRAWLERHHAKAAELWVGFHKVGTGKPSITWPESVDEALCFGWTDGGGKSLDERSYVVQPAGGHLLFPQEWEKVAPKEA
jgi:uncharacterized protein YdeI (YjbR/CyaY-like superfamily)